MKKALLKHGLALGWLACSVTLYGALRYVDLNNTNPISPYTNWDTAANVIQDAVDVAMAGDEIVVTNGVYDTGGRAIYGVGSNRVAVTTPLLLRSVNGPAVTVIHDLIAGHRAQGCAIRLVCSKCRHGRHSNDRTQREHCSFV